MAVTVRVKMLRPLLGDDGRGGNKRYERGEFRTMTPADAERLAATGAVEIVSKPRHEKPRAAKKVRGKKAPAPSNKRAPAPKNKSAT